MGYAPETRRLPEDLGGSWVVRGSFKGSFKGPLKGLCRDLGFRVVISGVRSPLIRAIRIVTLLITLLITTLNPNP